MLTDLQQLRDDQLGTSFFLRSIQGARTQCKGTYAFRGTTNGVGVAAIPGRGP